MNTLMFLHGQGLRTAEEVDNYLQILKHAIPTSLCTGLFYQQFPASKVLCPASTHCDAKHVCWQIPWLLCLGQLNRDRGLWVCSFHSLL